MPVSGAKYYPGRDHDSTTLALPSVWLLGKVGERPQYLQKFAVPLALRLWGEVFRCLVFATFFLAPLVLVD